VHRTLTSDFHFSRRVTQNALTRLLNALAWTIHDRIAAQTPLPPSPSIDAMSPLASPPNELDRIPSLETDAMAVDTTPTVIDPTMNPHSPNPSDPSAPSALLLPVAASKPNRPVSFAAPSPSTHKPDLYLQGLNVLAAPLLFTARSSEPAALSLLTHLLTAQLPSYFLPSLPGIHAALSLLAALLSALDPDLAAALPPTSTYAFAPIMTCCACIPPLSEVLRLWDLLMVAGWHLGPLLVCAVLLGMREEILELGRMGERGKLAARLRVLGPVDGARVVEIVRELVPRVPQGLWREIVAHTHAGVG